MNGQEKQKENYEGYTLIDLQGQLDRTYVVSFFFGLEPRRVQLKERWPASVEENLERLADSGFGHDRMIPKCRNCGGTYTATPHAGVSNK